RLSSLEVRRNTRLRLNLAIFYLKVCPEEADLFDLRNFAKFLLEFTEALDDVGVDGGRVKGMPFPWPPFVRRQALTLRWFQSEVLLLDFPDLNVCNSKPT